MAAKVDQFAQTGYISITESAAGTLTFNGMTVFSNILEPKGLVLNEAEYLIKASDIALMTAASDSIEVGLCGDNGITDLLLNDAQVYDYNYVCRSDFGTAASAELVFMPLKKTFGHMPGGGMLLPADRIYAFIRCVGLASAISIEIRFRFTIIDLTAQQYIELAQALRVLT